MILNVIFIVKLLISHKILEVFVICLNLNESQYFFQKVTLFSSTQMIASIFLLYILLLNSTRNGNLLRKMTGYYLLSSFEAWNSIAPIAKSELLTLIQKRIEVSEEISIGATVMAFSSISKTACYVQFQIHILLLLCYSVQVH